MLLMTSQLLLLMSLLLLWLLLVVVLYGCLRRLQRGQSRNFDSKIIKFIDIK